MSKKSSGVISNQKSKGTTAKKNLVRETTGAVISREKKARVRKPTVKKKADVLRIDESMTDLDRIDKMTDADIKKAVKKDPDTFLITDKMITDGVLVRRGRGPQLNSTKEKVSVRLDRDILSHYRGTGKGWQSRMNEDLKKIVTTKK